jgi:hypothetical protein
LHKTVSKKEVSHRSTVWANHFAQDADSLTEPKEARKSLLQKPNQLHPENKFQELWYNFMVDGLRHKTGFFILRTLVMAQKAAKMLFSS